MNKIKIKISLIIILVLGGVGFFYLHYNKSKQTIPPKTYWKIKVKTNSDIVPFTCEANKFYTFKSQHGFSEIYIDGRWHKSPRSNTVSISFKENKRIRLNCYIDGIWIKTGLLEIWKNKRESSSLLYLTTDEYNHFTFNVTKGERLDLPEQIELFYMGYFKDDKLTHKSLVKNDDSYFYRFWDRYQIKFKAAEVPFLFIVGEGPFVERLTVNGKNLAQALYMKKGDIVKTDIWLDSGDKVSFDKKYNSFGIWLVDRLLFSSGNSKWSRLSGFSNKYYTPHRDGYLKIKSLKTTVLDYIHIKRNKTWRLNLKPGQTTKIKIYAGDELKSKSRSRYYVDGELLETGYIYSHKRGHNGFIEFKASVAPKPINVSVVARRGL